MTPQTRAAIARAVEEISAYTTEEFRSKLETFQDDALVQSLNSIAEFAETIAQTIEISFALETSHTHVNEELVQWYDDILQMTAANDDRYLLAA